MIKKEFLFDTDFKTKEELFKTATNYLVANGYASPEFEAALNTREKDFPTGLPTVPPVAIPHTDGTFVKNDTILCIVNQHEVAFNEMGGDEEDIVLPKVFFMLVLGEGATHLAQLQNLIEKIQGGELVEKSLAAKSLEEFKTVVNTHL
jgi:PTS system galactitol-specific IIA component